MNITNEMLQAAMKKAIEAGLLPRNACHENLLANQELIRFILTAALDVAPPPVGSTPNRFAAREQDGGYSKRIGAVRPTSLAELAMPVPVYAWR